MNYAYIRVSTIEQDLKNQKHGLKAYAKRLRLEPLEIIEDKATTKKHWKTRKIGQLIEQLEPGDILLTPEVSRLARSTLEALEIMQALLDKECVLHITKDSKVIGGSIEDRVYLTVLGLAAEIERHFIQQRTRESLAARKKEIGEKGFFVSRSGNKIAKLGRPVGGKKKLKLDDRKDEVIKYLQMGLNKTAISKILNVSRPTLNNFIEQRLDKDQLSISFLE